MARLPSGILALSLVSLLSDVASEAVYPLLPIYLVTVLGAAPAALGLIEGVAETTASLIKLYSGALADRFGRAKPLVFAGYFLSSIAKPLLGVATNWGHVLGLRFLDRTGKGIRTAPRDAWLASMTTKEGYNRAYGFHRAMDNLGAVVGPLLAGAYFLYRPGDYRGLFLLVLVPGLVATALVLVPREEHAVRVERRKLSWAAFKALPRELRGYLGILLLFTLSNSSDAFLLLRLKEGGIPTAQIPFLWAALHVVKVAVLLPSHRLTARFGNRPILVAGWLVYALAYFAFGFLTDPTSLLLAFLAYGIFAGFTEGTERALIASLAPESARGTVFGLYAMTVGIAALPASVVFGLLWTKVGMRPAFYFGASLSVVAAGLLATRRSYRHVPL